MENKWTKKEQIKYKNLDIEDQEELRDHAFDWCVEFTHEDKVIDILNKVGEAMKEFKGGKKDVQM